MVVRNCICIEPSASGYSARWFRYVRRLLIGLVLVFTPLTQSLAEMITLNMQDADIRVLIETIAKATGRNFIVDPRVKGKVTVLSNKAMSPDEAYEVFLSTLSVHGFATLPSGSSIKIIPDAKAKQGAMPISADGYSERDQMVTRVVQVHNISAAQLVPVLRPLMPQQGHLAAYAASNVLILADRAANIKRIMAIIERIDKSSDSTIDVIRLNQASARDVVKTLKELGSTETKGIKRGGSSGPAIIADERTNSVLISGDSVTRLRLKGIIAHLDTPLERDGNTRVIYLQHAVAEELVPVLKGVVQNQQKTATGKKASSSRSGTNFFIEADKSTNAIVIAAAPDVMQEIESIIRQLDIRRKQVLIEGIVADMSQGRAREFGVQWLVNGANDNSGPVGVINFNGRGSGISNIAGSVDFNNPASVLTAVPGGLTLGMGDFTKGAFNFGAFVRALANDSSTNILSTPVLVAMDNEEASIIVGQNVPFVTGSYTSSSDSSNNPFQTIERQDVGLTLVITPIINAGNVIRLNIKQEISSVAESPTGAADLTTNKREINTSVLVKDQQIIVLGGLLQEQVDESVQKVPLLGDVPLLGNLFKYRSTTVTKSNTMVFLRPSILDDGRLSAYAEDKYQGFRTGQISAREQRAGLFTEHKAAVLPSWEAVNQPYDKPIGSRVPPPDIKALSAPRASK